MKTGEIYDKTEVQVIFKPRIFKTYKLYKKKAKKKGVFVLRSKKIKDFCHLSQDHDVHKNHFNHVYDDEHNDLKLVPVEDVASFYKKIKSCMYIRNIIYKNTKIQECEKENEKCTTIEDLKNCANVYPDSGYYYNLTDPNDSQSILYKICFNNEKNRLEFKKLLKNNNSIKAMTEEFPDSFVDLFYTCTDHEFKDFIKSLFNDTKKYNIVANVASNLDPGNGTFDASLKNEFSYILT